MGYIQCKPKDCTKCHSFFAKQDDMGKNGDNCNNFNPPNCDFGCNKACTSPSGDDGCFNYDPR